MLGTPDASLFLPDSPIAVGAVDTSVALPAGMSLRKGRGEPVLVWQRPVRPNEPLLRFFVYDNHFDAATLLTLIEHVAGIDGVLGPKCIDEQTRLCTIPVVPPTGIIDGRVIWALNEDWSLHHYGHNALALERISDNTKSPVVDFVDTAAIQRLLRALTSALRWQEDFDGGLHTITRVRAIILGRALTAAAGKDMPATVHALPMLRLSDHRPDDVLDGWDPDSFVGEDIRAAVEELIDSARALAPEQIQAITGEAEPGGLATIEVMPVTAPPWTPDGRDTWWLLVQRDAHGLSVTEFASRDAAVLAYLVHISTWHYSHADRPRLHHAPTDA